MKIFLRAVAFLIFLGIALVGFMIYGASLDMPVPDTTDLVSERPQVADEENAYTYFASATNSFPWPTTSTFVIDYLDGKSVDEKDIQEVVNQNIGAIRLIEKGLSCKICLPPKVTGLDTRLPSMSPWINMGSVMALTIRNDRLMGRYAEATSKCLSLPRFADLIQRDAESIIQYLVGISAFKMGMQQARDLAGDERTPQVELKKLSDAMGSFAPFEHGLIRAIKAEYGLVAHTVDELRDGKIGLDELAGLDVGLMSRIRMKKWIFHPNQTKSTIADLCRNTIKNVSLPYSEMKHYDVEGWMDSGESRFTLFTRPNALGKMLYRILVSPITMERVLENKCQAECAIAATRLAVACNAYKKKEGKLPDALQFLVPAYLPVVPSDPYDGNRFRYSQSKSIVYSVGKDLKDSGGSAKVPSANALEPLSVRRWKAEDIVFEIQRGKE